MKRIVVAAMFMLAHHALLAAESRSSSAVADKAISESISAVLQGDGVRARAALMAVPEAEFDADDAAYRACMIERFAGGTPSLPVANTDDAFVRNTLGIYQDYWIRALTNPSKREALADELKGKVAALLGEKTSSSDWDVLEARLTERLRERDHYAQLGNTPPLRELMIWRKQDSEMHSIELPEGAHDVRVEKLDDFVSLGWSSFARCGRGSNGGWVGEDRVFAVMPAFADEAGQDAFRASLLAHETQHFADIERFGELDPWRLEYRAKFAEVWTAEQSLPKVLRRFAASQSDDKDSPHTYANKRVLIALRGQLERQGVRSSAPDLSDVQAAAVRTAAREALIEDSKRLAESKL